MTTMAEIAAKQIVSLVVVGVDDPLEEVGDIIDSAFRETLAAQSSRIEELAEICESMERDAKRYLWLVSNVAPALPDTLGRHILYIPPLVSEYRTIDAAIDAAIAQTKEQP